jgi:uncharacterized protein (DUF885 family)
MKIQHYILLILILTSCQDNSTSSENNAHQALHAIFDAEKKYNETEFPYWSNVKAEQTHPEISVAAYQRRKAKYQDFWQQTEAINREALSTQDRINYDMYRFVLKDKIDQIDLESYLTPISADGGFHINFVYMRSGFQFQNEAQYERYLKVLESFKMYVNDHIALLKIGIQKGKTLPKAVLQDYESYLTPHIVDTVENSYFYEPFTRIPETITADKKADFIKRGKAAIEKSVVPGYQTFHDFIVEEYRPNAADAIGISAQPDGKKFYQQRVQFYATLPMTADEIFEKGKQEVARIRADMEGIIEDVGYEGSFADFIQFLRTDKQFYPKTARGLLMEASYFSKRIDGKLPEYFNKLPRLPYGVDPVPAAIAPKYTTGRYSEGSETDHRAGKYWVNTYKLESRPLYALPALTLHEAVPGHHLQISLAAEMEDMPDFRRDTYLSAFGEGWALYCEYLGDEMGIYETPYQHFGRMTYEMWRACRLVIDVGIHAKGWTRDEAVAYMASNSALSLHNVNTEIDRYIGWPGQALSYKIGELKIRELRKRAEKKLGAKFNIRDFHEVILQNGSVPLFILEEVVDEWIALKLKVEK